MSTRRYSYFKRNFARSLASLAASLLLAAAAAGTAACGDDEGDETGGPSAPNDPCSSGALEADLGNEDGSLASSKVVWHGPGVDEASGALKPGSYVLSSTYLRMKTEPQTQGRVQQVSDPIITDFQSRPGLVAFAFASSDSCTVARTFTVWESEEAMYAFVSSDAHRAAAGTLSEVSRGRSAVTHWSGTEADATWPKALAELGKGGALD
jgi:quinol monooxygenase YgiN